MSVFDKPLNAPVATDFFGVVSVSSSGSQPGGFRGIYVNVSTTLTMTSRSGTQVIFNDVKPGVALWISGAFINQIHTAATVIGLI